MGGGCIGYYVYCLTSSAFQSTVLGTFRRITTYSMVFGIFGPVMEERGAGTGTHLIQP